MFDRGILRHDGAQQLNQIHQEPAADPAAAANGTNGDHSPDVALRMALVTAARSHSLHHLVALLKHRRNDVV